MKVLRLFFYFILFFFTFSIFSQSQNRIKTIGKNQYIKFKQLQPYFKDLSVQLEKNSLLGKIYYKKRRIYFRIGNPFYVYNQVVERVSKSILNINGDLLIPPDFVEAIFINLIQEEILYEYKNKSLYFQLKKRPPKRQQVAKKPTLKPSQKPKIDPNLLTVIIDPGHGGKDPGTSSKLYYEKKYVLKVGLMLKKYLETVNPKRKIYITRDKDYFISLERRAKIANNKLPKDEKIIFISLHCNASLSSRIRGFEVYYLSQNPTTEKDREHSLIKNNIIKSNHQSKVKNIQAGLMSSLIQRRSRILAYKMNYSLKKRLKPHMYSRGVKKADFAVLRWSLMPAILIELGYISNYSEAKLLQKKHIIKRIFRGIHLGIVNYERSID